jgi:hydrogenase maturation protease
MSSETTDRRSSITDRVSIIGVGNPDRGDDAVGLFVARALAGRVPRAVTVAENTGDITGLVTLFERSRSVVLIDAARSGAEPGTIHRFDAAIEPLPAGHFRCSTHAFGIAEAIELARSVDRLPPTLIVYGIEGRDYSTGTPLSIGMDAAVDTATAMVFETVDRLLQEDGG